MTSYFFRPAHIAVVVGLLAVGSSVAEAGNFGGNLNVRTSAQTVPQTVYAGGRPPANGGSYTAPPYNYGRPGQRVHEFDRNTQFKGMTDTSANGKWVK